MKTSVSRLIIAAAVMLAPAIMAGEKASLPADMLSYQKAFRFTPGSHEIKSNADQFYTGAALDQFGLSREVFDLAMKGFDKLVRNGMAGTDSILTIVDFSKSSKQKRMVVVDLKNLEVLFHTVVAHGRNTGAEFARNFSNNPRSHMSSLGFYITRGTYFGSNGYSLKLDGLEKGYNDRAMSRAIVMHPADYANERVIDTKGYLGRSYGCPAIPEKISQQVINHIKNGNVLFIYYPNQKYLDNSKLLNG